MKFVFVTIVNIKCSIFDFRIATIGVKNILKFRFHSSNVNLFKNFDSMSSYFVLVIFIYLSTYPFVNEIDFINNLKL